MVGSGHPLQLDAPLPQVIFSEAAAGRNTPVGSSDYSNQRLQVYHKAFVVLVIFPLSVKATDRLDERLVKHNLPPM